MLGHFNHTVKDNQKVVKWVKISSQTEITTEIQSVKPMVAFVEV